MKAAQPICLQEELSGSFCWSTSSQNAGFLPPVVCLWFCFSGFKKNPSPQILTAKEPLLFTGSPYVDASDEGVGRLLLNVYLRLKIGKL